MTAPVERTGLCKMTNVDQKVDYPVERTGLYEMTSVDQNVAYTVERTGLYEMTNERGMEQPVDRWLPLNDAQ